MLDTVELELQGFVGYPMGCWEANLALQELVSLEPSLCHKTDIDIN